MQGQNGFWGERTATIDWCEKNYEVTYYIAEFWNTVSNLVLILFPMYGLYWSFKHISYSNKNSTQQKKHFTIPGSLLLCHLGLIAVGVGSWMFHMTLLYPMQLLDELPMIFGTGILIYANYDILLQVFQKRPSPITKKKSTLRKLVYNKTLIFFLILVYCLSVTYIYLYVWTNPIFHEIAYSLETLVIITQNVALIKKLKLKKRLYVVSFFYYMFGFLLWNIDNKFCDYLKFYRENLESYFNISAGSIASGEIKALVLNALVVSLKSISEFHSLWHIFTGYGSFMTLLFLTEVHYEHYLQTNGSIENPEKALRPVSSKAFNMYFHFNDNLINEKQSEASRKQNKSKRKQY